MLIHSHRKNTSVVIDFRETAPKSARPDRYMGNPKSSQVGRGSIGKKNNFTCLWEILAHLVVLLVCTCTSSTSKNFKS